MNAQKTHICQIDGRRFATKAALKQHELASHAPVVSNRGRGRGRGGRGRRGRGRGFLSTTNLRTQAGCTSTGNDIVDIKSIIKTADAGYIIFSYDINPLLFPGTRFAAEAKLWERWRPLSLRLEIISSASTLTCGSYVVGWSASPFLNLVQGVAAITTVSTMRPSASAHISTVLALSIPCDTTQKWYFVQGMTEDSTHGSFHAVLSAALGNITDLSKIALTIRLIWRVQFEGPTIPSAVEQTAVYADSGWEGYFTDSVSDWASGQRLTLKMHTGGSAVPFSSAKTGVVYKLDSIASLKYYKDNTSEGDIKYAVRIKGYYLAAFAVFSTITAAKKYIKSGDANDCLLYYKAGSASVTPSNPAWFEETENQTEDLTQRLDSLERKLDRLLSEGFSFLGSSSRQSTPAN